jgi:hypothetical protein
MKDHVGQCGQRELRYVDITFLYRNETWAKITCTKVTKIQGGKI